MKERSRLPNTLHELLSLALTDLKKCVDDDNDRIDMSVWHELDYNDDVCDVCMAGAVMAKTLNEDNTKEIYLRDYPERIESKLRVIDDMRCFDFKGAFARLTNNIHKVNEKNETLEKLENRLRDLLSNSFASMVRRPHLYFKEWNKVVKQLKEANI